MTRSCAAALVLIVLLPTVLSAQRATPSAFNLPRSGGRVRAALAVQQPVRLSCSQHAVLGALGGAVVGAATGWLLGGAVNMGGDSKESVRIRRRTIVLFAVGGAVGGLMTAALRPPCSGG